MGGLIAVLFIDIIAAFGFNEIAKMKGHDGYFVWCLLLGIIGWLIVIALPDRRSEKSTLPQRETKDPAGAKKEEDQLPEL